MTALDLATEIRRQTHTNTTTFPDADMLPLVNYWKDWLASKIQKVRKDIWDIPFLDDLVLDQREYPFPATTMNSIKSLELKFSSTGDYVLAEPIQRHHYLDALQESKIIENYDNLEPKYFTRRKSVYILSGAIVAVTNGFRVVAQIFPVDLSALIGDTTDLSVDPSNTTHGFPKEFHLLWARAVAIAYKDANNVPVSRKDLEFDDDLEDALDEFKTAILDEEITGKLPVASSRGDDGFDY